MAYVEATNYLELVNNKPKDLQKILLDTDELDSYAEYLLASGKTEYINYSNLASLKEYVDKMDPKVFMEEPLKLRYLFIKHYLDAKIDLGMTSDKLILKYIFKQIPEKNHEYIRTRILETLEPDKLTKKDIEYLNSSIYTTLSLLFLHAYKTPLIKLLEDIQSNDFNKSSEYTDNAIELLQNILSQLIKNKRRSKEENRINLTDESLYVSVTRQASERMVSESQFIKTGMTGLNKMLNGGLERGRCYNIIGATGGFKSGLMLNIAKQVRIANKGIQCKDPTKRPTILFISQENSIWETMERLFGIYATTEPAKKFKPEEIRKMLKEGGFDLVKDKDDIDFEFRQYDNMEIGVADIQGMVEELENEGREVILIIQDYIERLKPPSRSAERHQQLSDCSNQLHDLAKSLDVPVITGSQLNRRGIEMIEDDRSSNKLDIGKKVKTSDTSESFGMLKNFDVNIGIVIEYDAKEQKYYLSIKKHKMRGADTGDLDFFLQPFKGTNSKIQLMMDFDKKHHVYRKSLRDEMRFEMMDKIEEIERGETTVLDISRKPFISTYQESKILDGPELFAMTEKYDNPNKYADPDKIEKRDKDGFIVLDLVEEAKSKFDSVKELVKGVKKKIKNKVHDIIGAITLNGPYINGILQGGV